MMLRLFRALLLLSVSVLAQMPAHAQDAAELLLRLDRLEAENRRLTGQIDEMRYSTRRLEDQLKRFQTDADSRFRDLESGRGGAQRPVAPAPSTTPQRRTDAFDPEATPGASGAPRPLSPGGVQGSVPAGALPPGGRLVQDGELGAPLDVANPRRPPVGAAPLDPAPTGTGPKADFDLARSLIERGDNELAEGAFRDFLRTYPKDKLVPDATFWLGESYLRRTRYREAAEHYLTVTSKYSTASRAPEAMLKLGISLRGLGAKQEACGTFDQVPKKYPKASPAIRQAVDREKARAQC